MGRRMWRPTAARWTIRRHRRRRWRCTRRMYSWTTATSRPRRSGARRRPRRSRPRRSPRRGPTTHKRRKSQSPNRRTRNGCDAGSPRRTHDGERRIRSGRRERKAYANMDKIYAELAELGAGDYDQKTAAKRQGLETRLTAAKTVVEQLERRGANMRAEL